MVAGLVEPPDFEHLVTTYSFSAQGELLSGPNDIPSIAADVRPADARLVSLGSEAMVIVPNRSASGIWVNRLSAEGTVTNDWVELNVNGRFSYPAVLPWGQGALLAASVDGEAHVGEVLEIGADGALGARYLHLRDDESYFGWPALATRGGRVYVLYTTAIEEELFQVRSLVLGCN